MPASANRNRHLILATLCLLVAATLSMMVKLAWQPLQDFDTAVGSGPQGWTSRNTTAVQFFELVKDAFGTVPLTILAVVMSIALFVRKHRRAAYWTSFVMLGASLTTYSLKRIFQRDRPVWDDAITSLDTFAFPSGHSSGIASAMGVAIVLTLMLVRRRGLRRGLVSMWASLIVLVGLDRIFLGGHNFSDVVAGVCIGFFWVLLGLVVYHPAPRSKVGAQFSNPLPSTRQLAVVLNPIKVENVADFKALVDRMAKTSGWGQPDWYETTIEDPGSSMAEQAAISGAELVIACGGDGTVRIVCSELAGTGIPVGVVPAGTGNLLARNLGIPLYLRAAIDVAMNGQDRAIDLVAISGDGIEANEHFMVMAGMGFDAAIMEGANDKVKAKVGGSPMSSPRSAT